MKTEFEIGDTVSFPLYVGKKRGECVRLKGFVFRPGYANSDISLTALHYYNTSYYERDNEEIFRSRNLLIEKTKNEKEFAN